jgi:hypothetical protein
MSKENSLSAEIAEWNAELVKDWPIYVSDIFPDYSVENPDQSFEAAFYAARNYVRNLHSAVEAWSKGEEYPSNETENE